MKYLSIQYLQIHLIPYSLINFWGAIGKCCSSSFYAWSPAKKDLSSLEAKDSTRQLKPFLISSLESVSFQKLLY